MTQTNSDGVADVVADVVVIGGGSAGLSAALILGRARRSVVVLDAGAPRNRFAGHMHGLLGHDGTPPLELLARGRKEVESYGGQVWTTAATRLRRDGLGLAVETEDGRTVHGRAVLVATGLRDELPAAARLSRFWGRGVAVCPYCDAYEVGDRTIGILATGPQSLHQAQLLRQWSEDIVYLPHTTPAPRGEDLAALAARGIRVEEGIVTRVVDSGDRLTGVELADGRTVELAAIFTVPTMIPNDGLLRDLGAERTEHPQGSFVAVDPNGATSIPGVWAAGNVVDPRANVAASVGAAAMTAGAINQQLVQDDVAAARAS